MLMFYRYMPILTSMCKKVIIKPQKELAALFRENSYGAEVIEIFDFELSEDEMKQMSALDTAVPFFGGFSGGGGSVDVGDAADRWGLDVEN